MQERRADTRNPREAGSLQAVGRMPDFNSNLQAARRALGPASARVSASLTVAPTTQLGGGAGSWLGT